MIDANELTNQMRAVADPLGQDARTAELGKLIESWANLVDELVDGLQCKLEEVKPLDGLARSVQAARAFHPRRNGE